VGESAKLVQLQSVLTFGVSLTCVLLSSTGHSEAPDPLGVSDWILPR
jgi:hypothetical protein